MAATIAQLRLLLDDNGTGADQLLSDDELNIIIALEANVYRAAAAGARAIAAKFAERVRIQVEGGTSIDNQQIYQHYSDLADSYNQRAREGGGAGGDGDNPVGGSGVPAPKITGTSIRDMRETKDDPDRYPAAFEIGRDDNPDDYLDDDSVDRGYYGY